MFGSANLIVGQLISPALLVGQTQMMADEFAFLFWSQIQNYLAEADLELIPDPGQFELHGRYADVVSCCLHVSGRNPHSCRSNCGNGGRSRIILQMQKKLNFR